MDSNKQDVLKCKSPPKNRRAYSLTLKTTNMNNVDSYTTSNTEISLKGFAFKQNIYVNAISSTCCMVFT
jgi:hypothetical protein